MKQSYLAGFRTMTKLTASLGIGISLLNPIPADQRLIPITIGAIIFACLFSFWVFDESEDVQIRLKRIISRKIAEYASWWKNRPFRVKMGGKMAQFRVVLWKKVDAVPVRREFVKGHSDDQSLRQAYEIQAAKAEQAIAAQVKLKSEVDLLKRSVEKMKKAVVSLQASANSDSKRLKQEKVRFSALQSNPQKLIRRLVKRIEIKTLEAFFVVKDLGLVNENKVTERVASWITGFSVSHLQNMRSENIGLPYYKLNLRIVPGEELPPEREQAKSKQVPVRYRLGDLLEWIQRQKVFPDAK